MSERIGCELPACSSQTVLKLVLPRQTNHTNWMHLANVADYVTVTNFNTQITEDGIERRWRCKVEQNKRG